MNILDNQVNAIIEGSTSNVTGHKGLYMAVENVDIVWKKSGLPHYHHYR